MARPRLIDIPFVAGQREDVDAKLLPAGFLTRAKNVRLRKDGRWGVRYGDTAVALTALQGTFARTLVPNDLVTFDERLFAIGSTNPQVSAPGTDLCELVQAPQFNWTSTNAQSSLSMNLGAFAGVRDMGRVPTPDDSVTVIDVAAANGIVCLVFQVASVSWVHVFRADTDSTLLFQSKSITKPRVVSVGNTFFIGGISGTTVDLYTYDPATDDELQTETDLFGSGDAIVHWDMSPNDTNDGAWAAVHRSTPATSIRELNSSAAIVTTFAGPAVLLNFLSICKTANRVCLAVVNDANDQCDLYSYTTGGAQSPASESNLFSADTTLKQPGIADTTTGATGMVSIYIEAAGSPGKDVRWVGVDPSTHAVVIGDDKWAQTTLATKPSPRPGSGLLMHAFGGVQSEGSFSGNFLGFSDAKYMGAYKDRFEAGVVDASHLPRIAYDATNSKHYWPNLVVDQDGVSLPVVSEFTFASGSRRQTVDMGGKLYLFGGSAQVFDTRRVVEAGFQETPVIHSLSASNGAGLLPSSTVINVAVKWEWKDARGDKHESPLSEVATVTMGASDDTISFTASVPHSLRCASVLLGTTAKVVTYRSLSGKKQLRRALTVDVTSDFGGDVGVTLLLADASIAANEVVYTQGGRGGLGDTLEHESPRPADYAARFGRRILTGGLPNPFEWQVSKPEFPGEPINWSDDGAFRGTIPARIYGVAALDTQAFLFGRKSVFTFEGEGPDETAQGAFTDPVELSGALGLHSSASLVETPIGIMYQADEEKIALIPYGASGSQWFGQAVRDTLRAFPVVTASVVCQDEQLVTFACNNTGGTDGRLIHYDLRANTWIVDEFDGSTPITAIAEYQGRLARLSEGVITLQNTTHPAAAFIDHALITGTIRPFGENAWGKLVNITLLGEFRGNCILTCLISYNDGEDWTTLEAFNLSTSDGLVAGDAIRRQWWPRRRKGDRFMLEFRATALSGAASEGFVFNAYTLAVLDKQGETRLSTGKRG